MKYLLSCKCYCSYCGEMLVGESGTSKSGKIYNYYKCGNAKRHNGCTLRPVPRDLLETAVLTHTRDDMLHDSAIDMLVDKIMEIQAADDNQKDIETLEGRIAGISRKIENVLDAIENGGGSRLVDRLNALESEKEEMTVELARLNIKAPKLSREAVRMWLEKFRAGDKKDASANRELVDAFVHQVIVSNGEAVIVFNVTENGSRCSDTVRLVEQTHPHPNTLPFCVPVVVKDFILLRIAV